MPQLSATVVRALALYLINSELNVQEQIETILVQEY